MGNQHTPGDGDLRLYIFNRTGSKTASPMDIYCEDQGTYDTITETVQKFDYAGWGRYMDKVQFEIGIYWTDTRRTNDFGFHPTKRKVLKTIYPLEYRKSDLYKKYKKLALIITIEGNNKHAKIGVLQMRKWDCDPIYEIQKIDGD